MSIADEIRLATSQNRLHPLVRDNWASPRGICNCSTTVHSNIVLCKLDYGHEEAHVNGLHYWKKPWMAECFTKQ